MLTLKAPAKINWFLKIFGLRCDGFHEIQSLIQKITLYDVLTFALSKEKDIILKTALQIPIEQNMVYRAARLLKDKYKVKAGAVIQLSKNIPIGAGLGGGSSDAAAALSGLNELWSLHVPKTKLCEIGGELGSDVPFFLHGALSFIEGRGEKITGCRAIKPLNLLLVKPSFTLSTAWVYRNLFAAGFSVNAYEKDLKSSRHSEAGSVLTKETNKVNNITHFIHKIERAEISYISRYHGAISNELESVSLKRFPVIGDIKERLLKQGAIFSLMSGSGPTVFGVFDSFEKAEEASRSFSDFWTAAVKTIID